MTRSPLLCAAIIYSVSMGQAAWAQPPKADDLKKKPTLPHFGAFSKSSETVKALDAELELKDFAAPMKMREAIALINERLMAKHIFCRMMIDVESFKTRPGNARPAKDGASGEPGPIDEHPVRFPTHLRTLPVTEVLRILLNQAPEGNATYLIRKGVVVITTREKAAINYLLREKVIANFDQWPFAQAVYVLCDQVGASVTLDARAGQALLTEVNTTFGNDVSLASALYVLCDTAGLKRVVLGDAIYITTPENAQKLNSLPKRSR